MDELSGKPEMVAEETVTTSAEVGRKPLRYVEDLVIGTTFEGSRTITKVMCHAAKILTDDPNVVHRRLLQGTALADVGSGVVSKWLGSSKANGVPILRRMDISFEGAVKVGQVLDLAVTLASIEPLSAKRAEVTFGIKGYVDGKLVSECASVVIVPYRNRRSAAASVL